MQISLELMVRGKMLDYPIIQDDYKYENEVEKRLFSEIAAFKNGIYFDDENFDEMVSAYPYPYPSIKDTFKND